MWYADSYDPIRAGSINGTDQLFMMLPSDKQIKLNVMDQRGKFFADPFIRQPSKIPTHRPIENDLRWSIELCYVRVRASVFF